MVRASKTKHGKTEACPRVLLAKLGMDGHDIGIKVISRLLNNSGMEVVFLGPFQIPEQIVVTAIQEDVDVIGLSFMGGEHLAHTPKILKLLEERNITIPVVIGGIIPAADKLRLKGQGVSEVFESGTPYRRIVEGIERIVRDARSSIKGQ